MEHEARLDRIEGVLERLADAQLRELEEFLATQPGVSQGLDCRPLPERGILGEGDVQRLAGGLIEYADVGGAVDPLMAGIACGEQPAVGRRPDHDVLTSDGAGGRVQKAMEVVPSCSDCSHEDGQQRLPKGTPMADTPGNDAAAQVSATTRQAADSRQMDWAARAGLTARAVVYLLIGSLALAVASGSGAKMDQKGALAQVLAQPFGPVMVGLLAAWFVGYAAWRLTEVAFGVTGEGRAVGPRLVSLARALAYGFLAYTAVTLIRGSGADQSSQQQGSKAEQ